MLFGVHRDSPKGMFNLGKSWIECLEVVLYRAQVRVSSPNSRKYFFQSLFLKRGAVTIRNYVYIYQTKESIAEL